jgi:hypothetical protein
MLPNTTPYLSPRVTHCLSYLWTYDLYGPVRNTFDAGKYIIRASGKGLGLEIETFFGTCETASNRQANALWGPKKSSCCRPQYKMPQARQGTAKAATEQTSTVTAQIAKQQVQGQHRLL